MPDERDLTPEQEARVSRLLAEARHDGPIPADVAARLDRVLAGMADEEVERPGQQAAPVVDLAARRRRRAVSLLAAAAAVVVAGVGIGQVVGPDRGGDDSATSAGAGAAEDSADSERKAQPKGAPERTQSDRLGSREEPVWLTTKSFARDVRRYRTAGGVVSEGDAVVGDNQLAPRRARFSCGAASYGPGTLLAAYYNGRPAVLAYRPPGGDTQVVELLQCGSGQPIRSTTLSLH